MNANIFAFPMLTYAYTAVDTHGLSQSGHMRAACAYEATQSLQRRGLAVLELERVIQVESKRARFRLRAHARPIQIAKLFESLGLLLEAGLPLKRALAITHAALRKSNSCRAAWAACHELLEEGIGFTEAVKASFPRLEPRWVAVLRAGEVRGQLGYALAKIAHSIQSRERLQRKLMLALIYPSLVLVATVGVMGLLLGCVVPRFEGVFSQIAQGEGLPKLTQYIVMLSQGALVYGPWILAFLFAGVAFLRLSKHTTAVSLTFYYMPLWGRLNYARNWAQWTDSMAGLLDAGVPIPEAVTLGRESLPAGLWQNCLADVAQRVSQGSTLLDACKSSFAPREFFPEELLGFIEIGEHTGSLAKRLAQASKFYEETAERQLTTCMAALEPTLIVVMAVGVGTVILALFLPLAQLMERLAVG